MTRGVDGGGFYGNGLAPDLYAAARVFLPA